MILKETFSGTPYSLGLAHGRACRQMIASNLSLLVQQPSPLLAGEDLPAAERWFKKQRDRHYAVWPELADEMRGIAKGGGLPLELIEKLNFRIWQYRYYGAGQACTSFVTRDQDGLLIAGGTVDDPRELYFFVEQNPKGGFRYMTFPIAGTCWATRGANVAGLTIHASSLPLPGLKFQPEKVYQQDICMRMILQTCQTVKEAVDFCAAYPVFMHIIAVDAEGGQACFAVTDQGPFLYPEKTSCLTNHVLPPMREALRERGYSGKMGSPTSKNRLKLISQKIARLDGKMTLPLAKKLLSDRGDWPRSINNPATAFAMIISPQRNAKISWISDRPITEAHFHRFEFFK